MEIRQRRLFLSSGALVLVALSLLLVTGSCTKTTGQPTETPPSSDSLTTLSGPERLLYGIIPDSFIPEPGRIGRNQMISSLLLEKGFTYPEIDAILANNKGSFDARRVRSGSNYIFFRESDTAPRPGFLVYEHDNTISHIFRLDTIFSITDYLHPTTHELRFVSGIIESSLWEAMVTSGVNPMLAVELSEIYAWSIDFFGLQKGDRFRVIYEEAFTSGRSVGITSVNAALFTHAGNDILAVPFMQDSSVSFYDEKGNSLRKAFLKAPLRYSRISSGYSSGRLHPILKIVRPHYGVDYAAPAGTPVLAIGDGKVTATQHLPAEGRIVRIRHNSVYSTAYLHLSAFARGIAPGVFVKQGDVIGFVGSTGLSTGPHLDFRFYKNGSPVNPLKVESPSVEPVSEANMERYVKLMQVMNSLLETI